MERKLKRVTIRMTDEEWRAIRDAAFAAGKDIGPFVADRLRPWVDKLRGLQRRK